jgi:hypothetical protein
VGVLTGFQVRFSSFSFPSFFFPSFPFFLLPPFYLGFTDHFPAGANRNQPPGIQGAGFIPVRVPSSFLTLNTIQTIQNANRVT